MGASSFRAAPSHSAIWSSTGETDRALDTYVRRILSARHASGDRARTDLAAGEVGETSVSSMNAILWVKQLLGFIYDDLQLFPSRKSFSATRCWIAVNIQPAATTLPLLYAL